jgi:hypothetical protein
MNNQFGWFSKEKLEKEFNNMKEKIRKLILIL